MSMTPKKENADIEQIKERNRRVEADKAWETSTTRRFIIAAMTYIIIVVFLYAIDAPKPRINAHVPTIGFVISTLTLSFLKCRWLRNRYRH